MAAYEHYQKELTGKSGDELLAYLKANSHLPGPRGNLELVEAFYRYAGEDAIALCLSIEDTQGDDQCAFAVMCGVVCVPRISHDPEEIESILRRYAGDSNWRIRESTAIALQKLGMSDMGTVFTIADRWKNGTLLQQRAVVAGLCEPVVLKKREDACRVLGVLEEIAESVVHWRPDLDKDQKTVLKKALGYGISVAVAAEPELGRELMLRLMAFDNKDLRWIIRENLKKNRLKKLNLSFE